MQRHTKLAAMAGAAIALAAFGAGAARAADTLSWSSANSNVYFCNNTACGNSPLLVAGHDDNSGFNFNASTVVSNSHGIADAWAQPAANGLLPELHAFVMAAGPVQTPGQFNIATASVQGVQVFQWNGPAIDIDPTMFVGSFDYHADYAPAGPSGILAGFAILDASVLSSDAAAMPWYNFGSSANGPTAFQGDCSTPGAVAVGSGGLDRITSAPGTGHPDLLGSSINATVCQSSLHLNTGDEFVLWSKLFVDRSAPGVLDASHTFSLDIDLNKLPTEDGPNGPTQLDVQTLAGGLTLEAYDFSPTPEPDAWALMILGFGGIGAAIRRRRQAVLAA
jgi:MYXO-CTERM domain-containing protein